VPDGQLADGDEVWQDVNDESTNTEWLFLPVAVSPDVVSITTTTNATSCSSAGNGTITALPTGGTVPYTYRWDNGSVTAGISDLLPGNYIVTVTAGGRRYFQVGSIRTTAALIAEVTTTRETPLFGGTINIPNVINAAEPLSYAWSDGGPNSANRTNVPAGDYTVTITDGNGCQEIRLLRVVKTIPAGDYLIQHLPSGLYLEREGGQVLLGDCPTDMEEYRWTAIDEGGSVVKFRNNNGFILTVFGLSNSGAEYYTGGDGDVSPHKHNLIPTGPDTWVMENQFQGFYTGATADEIGGILIHEDLADPTLADEFRFIPIGNCTPTSGTTCTDSEGVPSVVNLLCECCGDKASLPVTLTRFSGEVLDKVNRLYWATTAEVQNAGFYLERSSDGIEFTSLAWVAALGNSNQETHYTFKDETPIIGTSYYRLRQLDHDGTESFSQVVVLFREESTGWTIFPNPAFNNQLLTVSNHPTNARFVLYDLRGREVSIPDPMAGENSLRFNLAGLPTGIYLLRNEADGSGKRFVLH
jgi:hypothetical protein